MPPPCADTVRALFTAVGSVAQDAHAQADVDDLLTEDIVYAEDSVWPGRGIYRGREEVRRCWTAYRETFGTGLKIEVVDVIQQGAEVVAVVRISGTTAAEIPFDHTWGYRCRCEGGQIAYFQAFMDPDAALAAG